MNDFLSLSFVQKVTLLQTHNITKASNKRLDYRKSIMTHDRFVSNGRFDKQHLRKNHYKTQVGANHFIYCNNSVFKVLKVFGLLL